MGILGADRATKAVLQHPVVLRSPSETIKGREALVVILGADGCGTAAVILKTPSMLTSLLKLYAIR